MKDSPREQEADGQATANGDAYRAFSAVSEAIIANRQLAASPVVAYPPEQRGAESG
jgi:hypothetical protein